MKKSLLEELDSVIKSVKGAEKPGHKYLQRKAKAGGGYTYDYAAGELDATALRKPGEWAVRPKGALGTMGFINGKSWCVAYVHAKNAAEAVAKARKQ